MKLTYIYGPVSSWRLGRSLGVDVISTGEKVCSFDCEYCQVGRSNQLTNERRVFVPTGDIIAEVAALPDVEIDYITFSGMGEPTLAANIGEVIREIKALRSEPIAVLTNSSLIDDTSVRAELCSADRVIAKLDAATQGTFERINHPPKGLQLTAVIRGLSTFRTMYEGQFDLQMMFMDDNESEAADMAALARLIKPDEVELNTPLRPPADKPLSPERLRAVQEHFVGMRVRNVYDRKDVDITPLDAHETDRRRPR